MTFVKELEFVKKRVFVRMLAVLLTIISCVAPMSVPASAAVIQENMIAPAAITTGVFWSNNEPYTSVARTLEYDADSDSANTKSLSALNLSPTAVKDGLYAYRFTWTSSKTSVAAVDADTGDITAIGPGTAVITGTSDVFGSSIGQLTLIVFVAQTVDVTMFALRETGVNRYSSFDTIETFCTEMGYSSFRKYGTQSSETTMDSSVFTAYMATSKILYFHGHGTKTSAVLSLYSDGSFKSRLYMSYLQTLPSNAFSYCDLILYGACLTGQGEENANNLVNATVDCGVNTVVGFKTNIYCNEMNIWGEQFFAALMNGDDVDTACSAAKAYIKTYYANSYTQDDGTLGAEEYYIGGDKTATFN